MATKYLGAPFDIHGGGMDLMFPHHESEIAQSHVACGCMPVKYWLHNNMITINGRKMGKSYNNTITLREMFFGGHELLERPYPAMTVRFFILQTQYRSTLDFSNEALQAAEKGLQRLLNAYESINNIKAANQSTADLKAIHQNCLNAMNDDFNTAIVIAQLFELTRIVNSSAAGTESLTASDIAAARETFDTFLFGILGIKKEEKNNSGDMEGLMDLILDIRAQAKSNKDFATSDKIRDELGKLGISIKDGKDGATWSK
jgi:cysteinyl-tRNA synthetase